jgi:hypothetical protein
VKIIITLMMLNMLHPNSYTMEFSAVRISKTATILLNENIENVFPLFGPVREMEWADGWEPQILHANDEVAEHMIFRTKASNIQEECYQWIITRYEPQQHSIEYAVSANERVWFIAVDCKRYDKQTLATVTYTYIGLSEAGHQRNREALEKMFTANLTDWEEAINYYLRTGEKLKN